MTKERASLDFGVSDIVVGPDGFGIPVRSAAAESIRLVMADSPKSHRHMDEIVALVRSQYPNAQVMFIAGQGGAAAERAAGAADMGVERGPAPPRTPLAEIIRRFSPRQAQVAGHLVQGLSNKEIARKLDLSESTVKVHVVSIFRALDVHSRARAVSAILNSPALQRELGL